MNTTSTEVRTTLATVETAISEIDRECCTRLVGIEHGLVNVKLEFRDQAIRDEGKKLSEERLIAWLVRKKLGGAGYQTQWEVAYPGNRRRKCDLVIAVGERARLWVELKLAWKAWFNCRGGGTYSNSCYLPYLQGQHHTHSFRHDFEKLASANLAQDDYRAVCLIGFDRVKAPMDAEVSAVVQKARAEQGAWEAVTETHWLDRRCGDFRINVWSWVLARPGC
jgi:hypothetical protein